MRRLVRGVLTMIIDPPNLLIAALIYAVAANIFAFACFGIDKRRAETGTWRISEASLSRTALFGGWVGAKLGQRMFRHKTRKQPFAGMLNAIGGLHLALCLLVGLVSVSGNFDWRTSMSRLFSAGSSADQSGLPHRFGPGATP